MGEMYDSNFNIFDIIQFPKFELLPIVWWAFSLLDTTHGALDKQKSRGVPCTYMTRCIYLDDFSSVSNLDFRRINSFCYDQVLGNFDQFHTISIRP